VTSLDELKLRIVAAIKNVAQKMLENTLEKIEYRLDISSALIWEHVEVI
jgi:hypothetical protein